MFGGLGNCPLCWDHPDICKCTQAELDVYYNNLKLSKEKRWEEERQKYHRLLDESFDVYKKKSFDFDYGSYPCYLAEQIIKVLNRGEWQKLKNQFDKYFKT